MSLSRYVQHPWVEATLKNLTLEAKIGQMLHPAFSPTTPVHELEAAWEGCEPGGAFLFPGTLDEFRKATAWLQKRYPVPVVVSSDLENGAGRMIKDATVFPDLMALGATHDPELARGMGTGAAMEGRAAGVHWTFGPVVDINRNKFNPITNTRSLGDNPDTIATLSRALITAMQEHGLAATAKHFPGDGMDDRDQHLCTTVNHLSREEWMATSGRMFREAIEAGVWTIMTGHIACPALDPGVDGAAPPATLSRILSTEVLRGELGFDGVIITDAMGMGGVTSWYSKAENLIRTVEAGSDMILFSEVKKDFPALLEAVRSGRLSEERIEASVRRLLALKVALGLHEEATARPLDPAQVGEFQRIRDRITERSITLVQDRKGFLEKGIAPGSRVLLYHMRSMREYHVDDFDELCRREGWVVTRVDESCLETMPPLNTFDYILVLSVFGPTWGTGRIRWGGKHMRVLMDIFNTDSSHLMAISFGSPYHLYEVPALPCYINAYSPDPSTQRAVIEVLTGRKAARGRSPVDLSDCFYFPR